MLLPFALGRVQQGASLWLLFNPLMVAITAFLLTRVLGWPSWPAPLLGIARVTYDHIQVELWLGQVAQSSKYCSPSQE